MLYLLVNFFSSTTSLSVSPAPDLVRCDWAQLSLACLMFPHTRIQAERTATLWGVLGLQWDAGVGGPGQRVTCKALLSQENVCPFPSKTWGELHGPLPWGGAHDSPMLQCGDIDSKGDRFSDAGGGKDQNKVLIISLLLLSPGCQLWLICRKLEGPVSHPGESL